MKYIINTSKQNVEPKRRRRIGLAALSLTIAAGAIVIASNRSGGPPPGQLLASQCFQCHGTGGQAVSGFESIAGKNASGMYNTLLEMSQRPPENIMDLQARAFTPAQLRLIANYLATLPPGNE